MNKKLLFSLVFLMLITFCNISATSTTSKIISFLQGHTDPDSTQDERNATIITLLEKIKKEDLNNVVSDHGMTLLHWAALKGNETIMKYLIARGADCKQITNDGTALHFASTPECVEILIVNGADVNAERPIYGTTPLHSNYIHRSFKSVKLLVKQGANVNAKSDNLFNDGPTPLHHVQNEKTALFLIKKGADVHAKDTKGRTPLHFIVRNDDKKVTKALLDHGAQEDINVQDEKGKTPLHYASAANARLLVNYGANKDTCDSIDGTPLHTAITDMDTKKVGILLECNADKYAICKNSMQTPLKLAKSQRKKRTHCPATKREIRDLFRTKPKSDQEEK